MEKLTHYLKPKNILYILIFSICTLHTQELFSAISFKESKEKEKILLSHRSSILIDSSTIDKQILNNIIDSMDIPSKFRAKMYDPWHTQRFHEFFHDISLHDIDSLLSDETLQYTIKLYSEYDKKNTINLSESDILTIKTRLQELRRLMMKEKIADLTNQYLIYSSAEFAQRTWEFYIFDPDATDLLETLMELNKAQEYSATIEYLKSNGNYNQIYISNLSETSSNLIWLFLHHYYSFELSHSCNAQPIDWFLAHYNTISQQHFDENTIKQYAQEFFDIHIQELKWRILNGLSIAIENGQIDIQHEEERKLFIIQRTETHNNEIRLLQQFSDKYKLWLTIKDRIWNI